MLIRDGSTRFGSCPAFADTGPCPDISDDQSGDLITTRDRSPHGQRAIGRRVDRKIDPSRLVVRSSGTAQQHRCGRCGRGRWARYPDTPMLAGRAVADRAFDLLRDRPAAGVPIRRLPVDGERGFEGRSSTYQAVPNSSGRSRSRSMHASDFSPRCPLGVDLGPGLEVAHGYRARMRGFEVVDVSEWEVRDATIWLREPGAPPHSRERDWLFKGASTVTLSTPRDDSCGCEGDTPATTY